MPDVVGVDEEGDVRPDLAAFGDDPIAQRRMTAPEERERVGDRARLTSDRNRARSARELGQDAGDLDGDHDVRDQARAVFTHTTGGSASRIAVHDAPASCDPNSFPLRVPK